MGTTPTFNDCNGQIATCTPAVSACGNDAVQMRREAASSVNDDSAGQRPAPIKWNDVTTAARVQSTEEAMRAVSFFFFPFTHPVGVSTDPRVRQKVIVLSVFGCRK